MTNTTEKKQNDIKEMVYWSNRFEIKDKQLTKLLLVELNELDFDAVMTAKWRAKEYAGWAVQYAKDAGLDPKVVVPNCVTFLTIFKEEKGVAA